MPRQPRPLADNALYHVTAHGIPHHDLFRDDDDRHTYLWLVNQAVQRHRWSCTGYCLMDTHVHLVVQTPTPTLSVGMRDIQGRYSRIHNGRQARRGPVWDGRFASELIERDEHYLEVLRYVPLNPVRGGLCSDPAAWRWSSHRAMAGLEPPPPFLNVGAALDFVGVFDGPQDRSGYLDLLAAADRVSPATVGALAATPRTLPPPDDPPSLPAAVTVAELARRHREERQSLADLAETAGCHRSTVLRRILRHEATQCA